jgi:hypothetical protein
MSADRWSTDKDGTVTAQVGHYRLTVVTAGGLPRFLIHGCGDGGQGKRPAALLASGTADSLAEAMRAAADCAGRRDSRRTVLPRVPRPSGSRH